MQEDVDTKVDQVKAKMAEMQRDFDSVTIRLQDYAYERTNTLGTIMKEASLAHQSEQAILRQELKSLRDRTAELGRAEKEKSMANQAPSTQVVETAALLDRIGNLEWQHESLGKKLDLIENDHGDALKDLRQKVTTVALNSQSIKSADPAVIQTISSALKELQKEVEEIKQQGNDGKHVSGRVQQCEEAIHASLAKTGEALFEIVNLKEQWKYMLQHLIQLEKDLWESVVRSVELHKTGQASGSRADLFEDEEESAQEGGTLSLGRVNSLTTMFRETFSDMTAKW